jgi:hypothetical protein
MTLLPKTDNTYDVGSIAARFGNAVLGKALQVGYAQNTALNSSYALDVNGSVNFQGSLSNNGTTWLPTQWTTTGSSLYYANPVNIGGSAAPAFSMLRVSSKGDATNSAASIVQVSSVSGYPINHHFGWGHDNTAHTFDAYCDGANWRSSHTSASYSIYKLAGKLSIYAYAPTTANAVITNTQTVALTVNSTGQVGILNASPGYGLDVASTAHVSGNVQFDSVLHMNNQGNNCVISLYNGGGASIPASSSTNYYGFGINAGTLRYNAPSSNMHAWFQGTTELGRFHSNGLLGVGTTSPVATIHSGGNLAVGSGNVFNNSSHLLSIANSGLTAGQNILTSIGKSNTANNSWYCQYVHVADGSASNSIAWYPFGATSNVLSLTSGQAVVTGTSGNVLKVTTPTAGNVSMAVSSSTGKTAELSVVGGAGDYSLNSAVNDAVLRAGGGGRLLLSGTSGGNANLICNTDGTISATGALTGTVLTGSGAVRIGAGPFNTSNALQLDLGQTGAYQQFGLVNANNGSFYGFGAQGNYLLHQSNTGHIFYTTSTPGNAAVNVGTERMRITATGVGFGGQTSPAYPIDVLGNINFSGQLYQNGSPYIGSQWTTTGSNIYYTLSCADGVAVPIPTDPVL